MFAIGVLIEVLVVGAVVADDEHVAAVVAHDDNVDVDDAKVGT